MGILVLVPRLTTSAMGGRGDASRASVTVSLPAVADVSLAAEFPDDNFNDPDFPFLEVDYWHNPSGGALTYVRLFLVRFDLTGLPANAVIDSAALQLHPNSCTKPGTYPVTMGSFYVTSDWYESTVTYNMRPTWGTVGVNNQVDCLPENPTTWYITSFAQAWQSDPVHNYGVKVSAPWTVGLDYSIAFNSREYYGTDLDPALVITYHLPTPTSTNTLTPTRTSTRTSTTTLTPTRDAHSFQNADPYQQPDRHPLADLHAHDYPDAHATPHFHKHPNTHSDRGRRELPAPPDETLAGQLRRTAWQWRLSDRRPPALGQGRGCRAGSGAGERLRRVAGWKEQRLRRAEFSGSSCRRGRTPWSGSSGGRRRSPAPSLMTFCLCGSKARRAMKPGF